MHVLSVAGCKKQRARGVIWAILWFTRAHATQSEVIRAILLGKNGGPNRLKRQMYIRNIEMKTPATISESCSSPSCTRRKKEGRGFRGKIKDMNT